MKHTTILPGDGILIIACPASALPVFFSHDSRPAYVSDRVRAIFPAHSRGASFHHTCIVEYGNDLGEMFSEIAEQYAAEVEREAHELSFAEEFSEAGYAANML